MGILSKIESQLSEERLRVHSDQEQLGVNVERDLLVDILHRQKRIIEILAEINPSYLERFTQ
jgi:hypothetical protein